jgi:hypothetical protein
MTEDQNAQALTDIIFNLPPTKRECALINRIALLEGRIEDLEQRNAELVREIALLRAML